MMNYGHLIGSDENSRFESPVGRKLCCCQQIEMSGFIANDMSTLSVL